MKLKLYLAGPLFTMAERHFNKMLAKLLTDRGFEVWLPQDHEPRVEGASAVQLREAIFQADIEGIDWADVVVANMDGPDPDSGTSFECGYACRGLKPIVTYRTDFRLAGDAGESPFNLMMAASSEKIVQINAIVHPDFVDLIDRLEVALRNVSFPVRPVKL